MTTRKPRTKKVTPLSIDEKVLQLEAGLDFQNRESTHLLDTVRHHHTEILEIQEKMQDLLTIGRIVFIGVILGAITLITIISLKP
jgi:hypothetical protein